VFKLKVSALYFLLTVASVVGAYSAVDSSVEEAVLRMHSRVEAGVGAWTKLHQLQQLAMHSAAFRLAQSELKAYLRTLDDFRADLAALEREVYALWPQSQNLAQEKLNQQRRLAHVTENVELIPRFVATLANRIEAHRGDAAWAGTSRDAFVADKTETLRSCAAFAVNNCFHKFTYEPLMEVLAGLGADRDATYHPDVVIVADRRGTGWANSHNATWSDRQDFGEQYPVVTEARRLGVTDDVVQLGTDETYFFVTVMAVQDAGELLGTVLVGVEIEEGLVLELSETLGMEVALAISGKTIEASVPSERFYAYVHSALEHLPEDSPRTRADVEGVEGYTGVAFYFHRPEEALAVRNPDSVFVPRRIEDLQVVLALDEAAALEPFERMMALIPLTGAFLFALGVGFFLVLLRQYTRPFEAIDEGIHEIVAGNLEHAFKVDTHEELPASIADNLNLMVAILTGKPIPEDDASAWGDALPVEEPRDLLLEMERLGQGDDRELGGAGRRTPRTAAELAQEPAEQYYRRTYQDYLAARIRTGQPDSPPYVHFVQMLVRHERELKKRLGCRQVRFLVGVKDDAVKLQPVPIR
jgi:hypothetical protein